MKIKHLIIVSLLLAVLTIGAVSAADDIASDNNMTADDAQGDTVQRAPEDDGVLEDPTDDYEKHIDVPTEIIMQQGRFQEYATVGLPSDAEGNISAYLDDSDVPFYNEKFVGTYNEISFNDVPMTLATHKLLINYTGDLKYAGFQNAYFFNATYDLAFNHVKWCQYGDETVIQVWDPTDIEGNMTLSMNGKKYPFTVYESLEDNLKIYNCPVTEYNFGVNNFTISVSNDPKYPDKQFKGKLKVESLIIIEYPGSELDNPMRYGDEGNITLILPSDAQGTLNVTVDGKPFSNEKVADGKFIVSLKGLSVGEHMVSINYTGSDYEVEPIIEHELSVMPAVYVPKFIYTESNETYSITVVLDENASEVLNITIEGEGLDCHYKNVTFNQVANGTVIVPIPDLFGGRFAATVQYGDKYALNDEGDNQFRFEVRSTNPNLNLNVTFPDKVFIGQEYPEITISNLPEDAYPDYSIYINGELDCIIADGREYVLFGTDKMHFGENTVELVIQDSRGYYNTTSASAKVTMELKGLFAEVLHYDTVYFDMNNYEGYLDLKVDGKPFAARVIVDGRAQISIEGVSLGNHTYELTYYDVNNVKRASKSGSFNAIYDLGTNIYGQYPLAKEFRLEVNVPYDATGKVVVSVDGKNYTAEPNDGMAEIILTGLVMGENNVTVSLVDDSKYPVRQIKDVINIEGYGFQLKDTPSGELEQIALTLPEDANGNITAYEIHYDDYGYIIIDKKITSVKLENGYAKIEGSEFDLGSHHVLVSYGSDDYLVENRTVLFTNLPRIEVDREVNSGENATVMVDLPGASGNVTVYRQNDYGWEKIASIPVIEGVAQGNFSLPLGSYCIKLDYEGDDIANPFGILGYEYYLDVCPIAVEIPEEFNADGSGEIILELPEGTTGKVSLIEFCEGPVISIIVDAVYTSDNKTIAVSGLAPGNPTLQLVFKDDKTGETYVKYGYVYVPVPYDIDNVTIPETVSGNILEITMPEDATGSVLVIIDKQPIMLPIVNGTVKVDFSNAVDGTHEVEIQYPGNGIVDFIEKTVNVTVKRPVEPRIVANDMSMIYSAGTKYTITVYGTDGKVAANVPVTFLINGKVFKTVNTDKNGIASVAITQKPGTYKITTQALGKSATKTLTVKHVLKLQKVKVKRSAKKLVIKATLSKVNGKYLKGKKITLKFKGKKYTAKTNKKGVAKFTIKKKVLKKLKKGKKVTYQATYLKDTVKYTVKVKK